MVVVVVAELVDGVAHCSGGGKNGHEFVARANSCDDIHSDALF